jgi:hypothetical protein
MRVVMVVIDSRVAMIPAEEVVVLEVTTAASFVTCRHTCI